MKRLKKICSIITVSTLLFSTVPQFNYKAHAVVSDVQVTEGTTSDGLNYSITNNQVEITNFNGSGVNVTIPDTINNYPVTSIGEDAFLGCKNLTNITIPNSVTSIGKNAFYECESLTSVVIPNSVTSIGVGIFMACYSLNKVTIPNSITSIPKSAFAYCTDLENVTIPNSVTSIGIAAFSYCVSLKKIIIPDGVKSIKHGTFYDCHNLSSVTIPGSVTSIGDIAFANSFLSKLIIPNADNVTEVGKDIFSGCKFLKNIYTYSNNNHSSGLNSMYDDIDNNRHIPLITLPEAPIAISAVGGNGQATVSYTAPKNNGGSEITDYKIDVYSGETLIKTVDTHLAATSVIVKELTNGTTYTFNVKATNEVGDSKVSSRVEAIPVAPLAVPGEPIATGAVAGNRQATVSFIAPKNNGGSEITDYNVDVYSGETLIKTVDTHSIATSVIVKELTNGITYTFDVKATNAVGDSKVSNRVQTIPVAPATLPGEPIATSAVAGNGQATVSFTAPKNNGGSEITDYKIDVYSGETLIKTVDAKLTVTSVIVKELTNGTSYTFDVKATNKVGDSKVSNRVGTTPVAPTPVTISDPVAAPISTPTTILAPAAVPISTPTTISAAVVEPISTQSMPKTATPYYNYIIIGLMTFMLGLGLWIYDSKRKKVK